MASWFDIRVLYLRVSQCSRDENPEALSIKFPSRSIGTALEVNGGRISPSEEALITLRRDRVDTDSLEVTYVTTDNLRASGFLSFEVYDGEDIIVSGALQQSDSSLGTVGQDSRWNMECGCAVGPGGCAFMKSRQDYANMPLGPPMLEILVVGRYSGSPITLTQSVQLITRRRNARCGTLDAIPEDEVCDEYQSCLLPSNQNEQSEGKASMSQKFYGSDSQATFLEDDDGDMSWFNAGVRVGVGIGLGMCLGVGIGVGLLVRTYQVTTKSLRRRIL
ncbi:hypothetical protein O6H91_18G033800 [Diphasiastrum complanatum]|uniref:Uncharacterized protein n=1 Tax=Diphasiastrum complanatum TaxID=34168 RepID=A0ACC2AZS0_DIPCM|nr:hypothetical protein O6H91_Y355900 [Diphasiastrum complanatum]KAJ7522987.1 hypothetical protein O6H91_18G033800 [Diphasiastrum complanatum]